MQFYCQGKKSAAFSWPGSDVNIENRYPTHWKSRTDSNATMEERINQVRLWCTESPVQYWPTGVLQFGNVYTVCLCLAVAYSSNMPCISGGGVGGNARGGATTLDYGQP